MRVDVKTIRPAAYGHTVDQTNRSLGAAHSGVRREASLATGMRLALPKLSDRSSRLSMLKLALLSGLIVGAAGCHANNCDTDTCLRRDTRETGDTDIDTGVLDTDSYIDTGETGHTGHTGDTDTADTDTGVPPNSPWYQEITSCAGPVGGLACTPPVEHRSVPDIFKLKQTAWDFPAGTFMMVFVEAFSATAETEGISMMLSLDDGAKWDYYAPLEIVDPDGKVSGIADPSIFQLDDGRLGLIGLDRIAFTSTKAPRRVQFYISESETPFRFTHKAKIFEYTPEAGETRMYTDPEIIWIEDEGSEEGGYVMMLFSNGLNTEETDVFTIPINKEFTEGFFGGVVHMAIPECGVAGAMYQDDLVKAYCRNDLDEIEEHISEDWVTFSGPTLVDLPLILEIPVVDPLQRTPAEDADGLTFFAVCGMPIE